MLKFVRDDVDSPLIRSTLYYALMDPTKHELTSYYSQFGYSFRFRSNDALIEANEAVVRLRSLTLLGLASRIDSSSYYGKVLKPIILGYAKEYRLFTDLVRLLCRKNSQRTDLCWMIFQEIIAQPCLSVMQSESEVGSMQLVDNIYELDMTRVMVKRLV